MIRFLRITGITEGISFLVLLLIAMPLKYYAGFPLAVKIVGWIHGVLFIGYIIAVFAAIKAMKWNFWDFFLAIAASLVPFGTFLLDKSWRARERAITAPSVEA
jgi:integral membrane protein